MAFKSDGLLADSRHGLLLYFFSGLHVLYHSIDAGISRFHMWVQDVSQTLSSALVLLFRFESSSLDKSVSWLGLCSVLVIWATSDKTMVVSGGFAVPMQT